ncbi:hypothetical protein N7468_001486 [Penicillium chermesinum]|uniref:Uncharacterized protein n=1 Tax=Penicillium chermesinum TaxID=63820 RepID=A0A9W9TXE2_9EURO|nr:uncharacterized protein N7468_001486 [Penicillium chermesinum]KAJ5246503.1 hypothetical protein N7468_001486 [Penicillium chermesinum]
MSAPLDPTPLDLKDPSSLFQCFEGMGRGRSSTGGPENLGTVANDYLNTQNAQHSPECDYQIVTKSASPQEKGSRTRHGLKSPLLMLPARRISLRAERSIQDVSIMPNSSSLSLEDDTLKAASKP